MSEDILYSSSTEQPKGIFIGIDPGKGGGIAIYNSGQVLFYNMPKTPEDLLDLLAPYSKSSRVLKTWIQPRAWIELVNGYGGNNSMRGHTGFVFGENFGICKTACAAHKIPCKQVRPQIWQKAIGLGNKAGRSRTEWKNFLKTQAQKLFPDELITLKIADAALILHAAMKNLI